MKIEAGKFYKTRRGNIVAVFEEIEGYSYPFQAAIYTTGWPPREISYTSSGRLLIGIDSQEDIISEWNPR